MYQLTNDESKQESNLQVSQDTLKQADDMPAFGSTFTFTRGFSYITSILIYARKAS